MKVKECRCGGNTFILENENIENRIITKEWKCKKCGKIQIIKMQEYSDEEYENHFQEYLKRDDVSVKDKFEYLQYQKYVDKYGFKMLANDIKVGDNNG